MGSRIAQKCSCGVEFNGRANVFVKNGLIDGKCRKCIKKRARLQGMHFFPRSQKKAKVEKKLLKLVKGILVMITILWSCNTLSQTSLIFNGGVGKQDSGNKFLQMQLETTPFKRWSYFKLSYGLGVASEIELSHGLVYFGSVMPMIEVEVPCGLYASAGQGIALISNDNNHLDGPLQFVTHLSGGLIHDGIRVGIFYGHISSGSSSYRNLGMDLIGIETGMSIF